MTDNMVKSDNSLIASRMPHLNNEISLPQQSHIIDKNAKNADNLKKRQARLLLVQAFYNIAITGMHHTNVIHYIPHITHNVINNQMLEISEDYEFNPDREYFMQTAMQINYIYENDEKIAKCIKKNPEGIDVVTFSILRAACHEMKVHKIHHKILINEYLEIAKSFFEKHSQISFINGVLHSIFSNDANEKHKLDMENI